MQRIDATYLVQLDEVLFDLQVGRDADGTPMLVLGELIELLAGEDGRIDSLQRHESARMLLDEEAAGQLSDDELEAVVVRRLRLSVLAGGMVGLRFEDALAALAA